MTPEQLARRNAAIRAAWDDPLRRALQSARLCKGGRDSDPEKYNAYFRDYRRKRKERERAAPETEPASGSLAGTVVPPYRPKSFTVKQLRSAIREVRKEREGSAE